MSTHTHDDTDLEKSVHNDPIHEHDKAETEKNQPAQDSNIVNWNGPNDPEMPCNWAAKRKASTIVLISFATFLTPLGSSMFAPGITDVMKDFHSRSSTLASFVVSVYILGYCFGPLLIAPLSEHFGRLPLYHACNIGFTIFSIACAVAPNMDSLITFRFFAGFFGSCPITIGAGSIADLIVPEKRGGVMAIWALGPLLGPVIGPVAGGFLSEAEGWRWTFWVLAIAGGFNTILAMIVQRETYPPVLLERKAAKLRKETNNPEIRSALHTGQTPREVFLLAIVRPLKMLIFSPIVLIFSIYAAIIYGILYLLFTTISSTFEDDYGFSPSIVGLSFLGIGVGCFLGLFVFGAASDRILKHMSAKGEMKPEYRLPPLIPGSMLIPIGLFWYGWSAQKHAHWIVPILGTGFVGAGLIAGFMSISTYLVDAFTVYAASAIAANTVLRSLGGAFLPLAGRPMYAALGLGWGNTLLGFIALAMCPLTVVFYKYGERIRKSPRFQLKL